MRTSHDELTLVCIQMWKDVLDKSITVVPPHEGLEIKRDFVVFLAVEAGVAVCTDVCAVASKVECLHDVWGLQPLYFW